MKAKKKEICRGELYYADLTPTTGSEQGGIRPVLVLQNNLGNRHSPTVIVAAITARRQKPPIPTHVSIQTNGGLSQSSVVLLEQLRTIDRERLLGYIGALPQEDMQKIDKALKISMGLDPAFL